jgi:hypothetical protein
MISWLLRRLGLEQKIRDRLKILEVENEVLDRRLRKRKALAKAMREK